MCRNMAKLLPLLLSTVIGCYYLLTVEAFVDWPPRSRAHRYFWDKDDEHTNKTVPIQRRHATTTLKTTTDDVTVNTVSNNRIIRGQQLTTRQSAEIVIISTKSPSVHRQAERFHSSTRWGSRHSIGNSSTKAVVTGQTSGHRSVKSAAEGVYFGNSNYNNKQGDKSPTLAMACTVPYRYGPQCEGICHCATLMACDKMTGLCKSGICAHGFMDPPACQKQCPIGQFGFRCGFYCHCWKGSPCDSVNGFCAPDGKCAEEWFGPSCQVRKLELSDAPQVAVTNCENITVSWRQWSSELDFGNPEIVVKNYELELRTPSRPQWRTIYRILSDDESLRTISKKQPLTFIYTPAPDTRFYQFRVVVNGLDSNGKYVTGVPSIPTEVFQRTCPTEDAPIITDVVTLPTPVTAYPSYPTQSIEIVTDSTSTTLVTTTSTITSSTTTALILPNSTTTATSTTVTSTTTAPIIITDFQVTNSDDNLGTVHVSWQNAAQSSRLPQDAGLLVENIGIGDCDPFQTTEGPQIFKLSNTSVQTLRLERWRQYRITLLRSIAASDVNLASLASKIIVTTGKMPSAAVDNLQLEDVTSRTAKLSWSPLACEDRGDKNITYEVNVYRAPRTSARSFGNNGTKPPPFLTITTNRTWVLFTQLSPSFEYLVKIIAKNKYGSGPVSRTQFTTLTEEQPRPAPSFLPVTDIGPDHVTLAWSIPAPSPGLVYPALEACELKMTPADSVVPVLLERYPNCSQTNRTVDGLRSNTRYLVELTQFTLEGQNSYQTMIVSTPEAQPGPPLNVAYHIYNKTCSEIDWLPPNPPNGVITNYSLYLSVLDSYMPLRRQSVERYLQREPGRILCSLMLSTRYSFTVQAATSAGYGPMTELMFWTPIAEPDPPPVPFARLSDEDNASPGDQASIIVLAQPLRFSTGVITAYFLKLATVQQLREYESIYGISTNGTSLYITPDTKTEAALAALPGRLVHRVLPDRFEQQQGGPLLHQAILEVPTGQLYRVIWAVSVQLENDTRLAASASEIVRVPGPTKPPVTIDTKSTYSPSPTPTPTMTSTLSSTRPNNNLDNTVYNTTIYETKSDERVGWVFGIVIALIILLVVIGIIVILICCCWKRYDVPSPIPDEPVPPPVKWRSSECIQTDEPPLNLEDWFNPTTQVDDSRYVVRGQRILTPTRYTTTRMIPPC